MKQTEIGGVFINPGVMVVANLCSHVWRRAQVFILGLADDFKKLTVLAPYPRS